MSHQQSDYLVGAVVIGRNEGQRLIACLDSLLGKVDIITYVDSGSEDNSLQEAKQRGVITIALDMSLPFTAARARNTGVEELLSQYPRLEYIQFVDGDCELNANWVTSAKKFLNKNSNYAAVCGRLRERLPELSIYNKLMDIEWDVPIGEVRSCGGIAMMRVISFKQVDGFRESLIAGEEPEMCFRMRAQEWKIYRLDSEMAKHDAAMTKFSQWWKRSVRAGYAFSEGASLHGGSEERYWVRERNSIVIWGMLLPFCILLGAFLQLWFLVLFMVYPLQLMRVYKNSRLNEPKNIKSKWVLFTVFSKFPQAIGLLQFYMNKYTKRTSQIIEYK